MAYVTVPKDLSRVKTKVLFNLTKRQLVCFGGGALIGVPLFFLLKGQAGTSVAALCMVLVMLPFFLLGVYEKTASRWKSSSATCCRCRCCAPSSGRTRQTIFMPLWNGRQILTGKFTESSEEKEKKGSRSAG